MEWIRHRPKAAAAVGVVSVIAVLALVFLLTSPKSDPPQTSSLGDLTTISPSAEPTLPEVTPTPSATASVPTAAEVKKATQKAFNQLGQGFTSGSGLKPGQLDMPGLQGGSIYQYLPKHKIVMRVTSSAPIGTIGYVVPTSLNESSGVVRNVGGSWSLGTTAYGDPDYAQLFMQADSRGHQITCTITVDGRVTEKRTTEGPYARLICQG